MLKYFFFTEVGNKAVCLLCGQSVDVLNDQLDVTRGTELDRKLAISSPSSKLINCPRTFLFPSIHNIQLIQVFIILY